MKNEKLFLELHIVIFLFWVSFLLMDLNYHSKFINHK